MEVIFLHSLSKGLEGRAYRQLRQLLYIDAVYQSTWCKAFGTRSYKRSLVYHDKMVARYKRTITRIVESKFKLASFSFEKPILAGSSLMVDIRRKQNQCYLIKVFPK